MFLKKSKSSSGRTYISIVEGYRIDGKVKQRTIKKIGFLDDLLNDFEDPISHFTKVAKDMTASAISESHLSIDINTSDTIDTGYNLFNVGYAVLKNIYLDIDLTKFFKAKNEFYNVSYSFNKIFQLLVFSRILYPASKRDTFNNKDIFFEPFSSFSLPDIYKSLDYFCDFKEQIQKWLWMQTKDTYNRDASTAYYDCTNYYFEIELNDEDGLSILFRTFF